MTSKNKTIISTINLLVAFTVTLSFQLHADENKQTPLPEFKSCSDSNRPLLPAKWESGALLQHFSEPELITANIVYDSDVSAMRFTLIGMSGRSGDFLLLDDGNLYGLSGGYPNPKQCRFIANTDLKVPGRQWLEKDSLCVGEAKVTNKDLIWWKYKVAPVSAERAANSFSHSAPSPGLKNLDDLRSKPPAGADWIWYHKENRLPFRTMFSIPNNNYGILGLFTFNYLPTFNALDKTNLSNLKNICQNQKNTAELAFDTNNIEGFLTANSLSSTQIKDLPGQWVPGLQPTSAELPPAWPVKAEITTFMTSVNYCYAPFPTRVYYDWQAQSQLTSMYWNNTGAIPTVALCSQKPEFFVQEALLRGKIGQTYNNTGFIFNKDHQGHPSQCLQVLPGVQIPNWKSVDGCVAKAQLAAGSILNPTGEIVKILRCPITSYGATVPQNFWTWYSVSGTPMVFMQSNSNTDGTGLNLADYYSFTPGQTAPTGSFDLPKICINQDKQPVPKSCHNCHLPLQ